MAVPISKAEEVRNKEKAYQEREEVIEMTDRVGQLSRNLAVGALELMVGNALVAVEELGQGEELEEADRENIRSFVDWLGLAIWGFCKIIRFREHLDVIKARREELEAYKLFCDVVGDPLSEIDCFWLLIILREYLEMVLEGGSFAKEDREFLVERLRYLSGCCAAVRRR